MKIVLSIVFTILFLTITAISLQCTAPMHKTMSLTDLNYKVVETTTQVQPVNIEQKGVLQTPKAIKTTKKQQPKVIVQVIEEHVKTKPQIVKTSEVPVQTKEATIVEKHADIINKVMKNTEQLQNRNTVVTEQHLPTQVKTVDVQNTPLTEEEEIIAWNKWRSDLQNKVMMDTNISAPIGTTFYFSCTVDKYGNISNINTWSGNDNYTPTAKRAIKPVLASYHRTAILNFPARTKRTIVQVDGNFTIAPINRYSTPDDYSDYERITR